MKINNINDFCKYFGSDSPRRLEHDIYKYTDCGAWIKWDDKSVTIGSIVEGSDAEFDKKFSFPVESKDIDDWLDELNELTDEAWHEANDDDLEVF